MEGPRVPLARLFVMGAGQLIAQLHERLADEGWSDIRPSFGFVLARLREEPATITSLAAFLGITKQAGSKLIEQMDQAGLVEVGPHPSDARARLVTITPEGGRLRDAAERIYADLEAVWAREIGADAVEAMRRDLGAILRATNDGELPPIRPI